MIARLLQLLALWAVVSPYCCCDAVAVPVGTRAAESAAGHACCGGSRDADSAPRPSAADHDCPHQTASGSIQSFLDDFHVGGLAVPAPTLAVLPAAWAESGADIAEKRPLRRPVEATGPPGTGPSRAIRHCSFLL